eukprot:4328098-Amphidinium_carterae.1
MGSQEVDITLPRIAQRAPADNTNPCDTVGSDGFPLGGYPEEWNDDFRTGSPGDWLSAAPQYRARLRAAWQET